jgi:hypothetical protein
MIGYTGYSWSNWNGNVKLKEKSGSCTGKTFDRFTTADSCTWNSTHNTESAAVWNGGGHRWFKRTTGKKKPVKKSDNDDRSWGSIVNIVTRPHAGLSRV